MISKKILLSALIAIGLGLVSCSSSSSDRKPAQSYQDPSPVTVDELRGMFINAAIYARHKRSLYVVATDEKNIASVIYCETPVLEPAKRLALHMVSNCLRDDSSGFVASRPTLEKINRIFPGMIDEVNKEILKMDADEQRRKRFLDKFPQSGEVVGILLSGLGLQSALVGYELGKVAGTRGQKIGGQVLGYGGGLAAVVGFLVFATDMYQESLRDAHYAAQTFLPVDETLKQRFSLLMNEKKISVEAQKEIIQELFSDSWLEERVMGLIDRAIRQSIKQATSA